MKLDDLTTLLAYLTVTVSLTLPAPCTSSPDVQTATAAHKPVVSSAPRKVLHTRLLFVPPMSSPSTSPDPPPDDKPTPPSQDSHGLPSSTLIAVLAATSVIVAVCCSVWVWLRRKKRRKMIQEDVTHGSEAPLSASRAAVRSCNNGSDSSDSDYETNNFSRKIPKKYSYNTLALATSNFNFKNKLGEGGFGPVFKGLLKDEKSEVAVKRVSKKAKEAPKQYKAEVKILTRLSHRYLVELLGWCEEEGEFLLVYRYMPNGSLNSQLYNKSRLLSWDERYKIVLGLASALNYLHEECEECILHRDIKPENVLLDSSFNAKLSDFGLARLVDHDIGVKNTTFAGTMGYMAPEYILESRASKESDIYSFGVVLLEIACGQAPLAPRDDNSGVVTNLIDVVWDHYGQNEILEMADKRLQGEYSADQMQHVMIVGLWCAHPIHTERPTIVQATKVLKFDAPLPELPPSKPELLPLLADHSLQPERTKSCNENSTGGWISRSSGCATQSSLVSTSISSSAATA